MSVDRVIQRQAHQQQRIEAGKEVAGLERGQARVDARESRAAHDGHVNAAGQRGMQYAENRNSCRIDRDRAAG